LHLWISDKKVLIGRGLDTAENGMAQIVSSSSLGFYALKPVPGLLRNDRDNFFDAKNRAQFNDENAITRTETA